MDFEKDIFISYAHIDDESISESEKGWITEFHRALEIRLSQLLGERPKIWRDSALDGNHDYDKELDNTKRLKMIIEECLRLSRLENEIIHFYKNNKDRFLNNKNSILEFTKQTDVHISNSIINF